MYRYIKALAESPRDVLGNLDAHTDPCMDAITQLWIFPDAEEYHQHWSREVWHQLYRTKKLKSTKKFPTKKQIFENTFEDNKHIIPSCINAMIEKESDLTPDYSRVKDVEGLTEVIRSYFDWMSEKLSSEGVIVSADETRKKLKELRVM